MTIAPEVPAFTSAEGLRLLLVRLFYFGPDGWRTDPEATALMAYAVEKYGALARKHGFEPVEAATAAFDAMRTRAVRVSDDPWAVVTKAVELTLIYECRAEGLLCSTHQARREAAVGRHDAERFSDRETDLSDYHPALWVAPPQDQLDLDDRDDQDDQDDQDDENEPTNAFFALDDTVAVFTALGWPGDIAHSAIEYVCSRLMRSGNRGTAFEALRRDRHAQALLDVDQRAWLVFLRVVLGNQHPDRRHTAAGRGLLLRLCIGDRVEDLVQERDLVAEIARIRYRVPRPHRTPSLGSSHV